MIWRRLSKRNAFINYSSSVINRKLFSPMRKCNFSSVHQHHQVYSQKNEEFIKVLDSKFHVDKSILLKEYFHDHWYVYLSSPPGFGRTFILELLKNYCQINLNENGDIIPADEIPHNNLFQKYGDKLEMWRNKSDDIVLNRLFNRQFGRYPIIHLDFNDLKVINDFGHFLDEFRVMISKIFTEYSYILKEQFSFETKEEEELFRRFCDDKMLVEIDEEQLKGSLDLVCLIVWRYFKKKGADRGILLLIDNIDSPFDSLVTNPQPISDDDIQRIFDFTCQMLSNSLKSGDENSPVQRGFFTGSFPFLKDHQLTNVAVNSFLKHTKYTPFLGFKKNHVDLFIRNNELLKPFTEQIHSFSNGYTFRSCLKSHKDIEMYQQSSLLWIIQSKLNQFEADFHVENSYDEREKYQLSPIFKRVFQIPDLNSKLKDLIDGKDVPAFCEKWIGPEEMIILRNLLINNMYIDNADSISLMARNLFFQYLYNFGLLSPINRNCTRFKIANERFRVFFKQHL